MAWSDLDATYEMYPTLEQRAQGSFKFQGWDLAKAWLLNYTQSENLLSLTMTMTNN